MGDVGGLGGAGRRVGHLGAVASPLPDRAPRPDPLFTPLFLAAAALNVFWVAVIAVPLESVSLGAIHLAFAIRLLVGRQRTGRVRARDLQRFRDLRP